MRGFHFGNISRDSKKCTSTGQFALHLQCPWRFEKSGSILTGQSDLWESPKGDEEIDWESWHFEKDENLQDKVIGELLGGIDEVTRSFENHAAQLVVEVVESDSFGGARIFLSGGIHLVIFPAGSKGEDWRLLSLPDGPHFVICGGKVEL